MTYPPVGILNRKVGCPSQFIRACCYPCTCVYPPATAACLDGGSAAPPAPQAQVELQPAGPEPDSMDEFLAVMREVEERQAWMIKMKKLGALKQDDEVRVKAEIAERVAKMKTLDKTLQRPQ